MKIGDFGLATVKSRFSQVPPDVTTGTSVSGQATGQSVPVGQEGHQQVQNKTSVTITGPAHSGSNSTSSSTGSGPARSTASSLSLQDGSQGQVKGPTGSILWMAPEVIRMKPPSPYSFQSDVYSFGVVIFELGSGRLPYSSYSKDSILFLVGNGILRPDPTLLVPGTPKPLTRLMNECLSFDPTKRPLFRTILASLESLLNSQPSIQRSVSEPASLNRMNPLNPDLSGSPLLDS